MGIEREMSEISASRRGAATKAKAPRPAKGKKARLEARPAAAKAPPPPAALILSQPTIEPEVHCSHDAMAPLITLKPNPRNPNKHPAAQLKLLAKVIARAGWRSPIVVSNRSGLITKGHGRFEAAKLAGMTIAPIDFQDYASEADELADMIADNRLAELAELEMPDLKELIGELEGLDFDMDLTGYGADEIDRLMAQADPDSAIDAPPQISRADELNAKWQVERGDVWNVGEHRLICGDSTARADVERLFAGQKMQLCFTDPPYGAEIEYATHDDTQDELDKLIAGFMPLAQEFCPVVAMTTGVANLFKYPPPTWLLCWFYAAGTGRSPWGFTAWQPVAVWGKDPKLTAGEGCHPDGFQFMMSTEDAKLNKTLGHACPKPTSVWLRFLERLTNKDTRNVFEPFLGSGTTMVVCENMRRHCYGIEISPSYCAVVLQRMSDAFPTLKIERAK